MDGFVSGLVAGGFLASAYNKFANPKNLGWAGGSVRSTISNRPKIPWPTACPTQLITDECDLRSSTAPHVNYPWLDCAGRPASNEGPLPWCIGVWNVRPAPPRLSRKVTMSHHPLDCTVAPPCSSAPHGNKRVLSLNFVGGLK